MDNRQKYIEVFKTVFEVPEDKLDNGFNFKDVEEWDSLRHMTLISELEDVFDVMFETDDILHFGGFMNGIEILKRYGIEF